MHYERPTVIVRFKNSMAIAQTANHSSMETIPVQRDYFGSAVVPRAAFRSMRPTLLLNFLNRTLEAL